MNEADHKRLLEDHSRALFVWRWLHRNDPQVRAKAGKRDPDNNHPRPTDSDTPDSLQVRNHG